MIRINNLLMTDSHNLILDSAVCDYGLFYRDKTDRWYPVDHTPEEVYNDYVNNRRKWELVLCLNSRSNAIEIMKIVDADDKHESYEINRIMDED